MNIFVFSKMKLVNQCHTSIVCNITGERQIFFTIFRCFSKSFMHEANLAVTFEIGIAAVAITKGCLIKI